MRALGRGRLPESVVLADGIYTLDHAIKHDFFAATALYDGPAGAAVVKVARTAPFMGLPLIVVGQWLRRREMRFYRQLADLPNIPEILGAVGPTGFAHRFIPGRPLAKNKPVPDGFFDELLALMRELHRRGLAYVDANKPENILLGDDGRPHLIDFQISWDVRELGDNALNRWWLRHLQASDTYHVLKHKRRLRPDELRPGEAELSRRRGPLIRFHRVASKPYFWVRRSVFGWLRGRNHLLPEGSK